MKCLPIPTLLHAYYKPFNWHMSYPMMKKQPVQMYTMQMHGSVRQPLKVIFVKPPASRDEF